jgi:predicted DNA-binding transcriptional regulator AlpA
MITSLPSVGDPEVVRASGRLNNGLTRLKSIIKPHGPIPVSRSTWWAGVKSGRFPAPVKLGPRITAWREEDISKIIREGALDPGCRS